MTGFLKFLSFYKLEKKGARLTSRDKGTETKWEGMLLSSRACDVSKWRQEVNSLGKCGFGALLESRPIHLHLKRKLRKEHRSNHGISFLSAV